MDNQRDDRPQTTRTEPTTGAAVFVLPPTVRPVPPLLMEGNTVVLLCASP